MIVFLLHFGRYNLCTRRRFKNHKFIEYAKGEEVPDAGKRQVFSGDVEKDILKTARGYGRIDTIAYDRRDVKVTELVYIEDGYIVSYKEMKGKPVRKV